jgi:hypothetical protein
MSDFQMRSPAPRVNAGNRAEVIRNAAYSFPSIELEGEFVALFNARCSRRAAPLAGALAARAVLGRAFI